MRVVVVGVGAVGARAARQLVAMADLEDLIVVDPDETRRELVVTSLGPPARSWLKASAEAFSGADVVLLAHGGSHRTDAAAALGQGAHVVSTSDNTGDVVAMLSLDAEARRLERHVVVGAGFSPGLSCVLAAFAAQSFERIDEIHVAKVGAGGPACRKQLQRALRGPASEWRHGSWAEPSGGSGRELCWFPDPIRAVDCYRAELADPKLLVPAFAGVNTVTARVGSKPSHRMLSRLPLVPTRSSDERLGAVRVEIRGFGGSAGDRRVFGAIDRPSVAAGAVAAQAARWVAEGRLLLPGAAGLAALVDPGPFLAALAIRGVKVAILSGEQATLSSGRS